MATFEVQRKAEIWYTTTVEATSWQEAINIADSDNQDWELAGSEGIGIDFVDEWWVANNDTNEEYMY